jgi:hypothetical protein
MKSSTIDINQAIAKKQIFFSSWMLNQLVLFGHKCMLHLLGTFACVTSVVTLQEEKVGITYKIIHN